LQLSTGRLKRTYTRGWRVAQPPRNRPGQFNRIAGSSRAMTPFNMLGVSYVFAIALLTIGAMAV
jgi:hypothetical protein